MMATTSLGRSKLPWVNGKWHDWGSGGGSAAAALMFQLCLHHAGACSTVAARIVLINLEAALNEPPFAR